MAPGPPARQLNKSPSEIRRCETPLPTSALQESYLQVFCDPTGDETLKDTTTISTTHQDDAWTSRQIQVVLAPSHKTRVRCYHDTVFDSYVFQLVPVHGEYWAEGTATDESGNPLPHEQLNFRIGDRSVLSQTDAQGRYAICTLNPVPVPLRIGKQGRQLTVVPKMA